jgi:hypothetical protein
MANNRRNDAMTELGFANEKEENVVSEAINKEELRRKRKEEKLRELQESDSYQLISFITTLSDKYFLDPIIGLFPVVGDIITSVVGLPFIYVTLVKVRSFPLTLAVIYNYLIDMLLGCIPFWIGDIIDFFNKAHIKNMKLITHYVQDDKGTVNEVNSKALRTAFLIVILSIVIYYTIKLVSGVLEWGWDILLTCYHWLLG